MKYSTHSVTSMIKKFIVWVDTLNIDYRYWLMAAFISYGVGSCLEAHAARAHLATVEVFTYADYVANLDYPDCSPLDNNTGANIAACVCYAETGNLNYTQQGTNLTVAVAGQFGGGNMNWASAEFTCNSDTSIHVFTMATNTACVPIAAPYLMGQPDPNTLFCGTNTDVFTEYASIYGISGGGDIDMTEMIDAMNLNAEQIATLILICCMGIAMFFGFKTGLTR